MIGLYIHIPFCAQKCYYCDFNSYTLKDNSEKNDYIKNLEKEMNMYKNQFENKSFTSIFIGGGTPSILNEEEIEKIIKDIYKNFNIDKNAEITIECNPGTLNKSKLHKFKKLGINRISMGLQVTQNQHLKKIGRIHTYEQFEKNYKEALEVGFSNINIDLMYSLPNQKLEDWMETLEKIIKLNPTHISAYSLILEEGTKFYEMYENKELELTEEETDIEVYEYTIETLKNNGYNQYEISNYSKPGYECKHNILYWKCENYLGLGAGASGYIGNERYSNVETLEAYNEKIKLNIKPIDNKIDLNKKDEMEEFIFMGLRMNEGLDLQKFEERFNVNFKQKYNDILKKMKNLYLIEEQNNNVYLTQKGRELSNTVFIEFIE